MKLKYWLTLLTYSAFTLFVFLASCVQKSAERVIENNIPVFMAMDSFFAKYPTWNNNDVTRKRYSDTLNRYFINRGVFDFDKNVPLAFTAVETVEDKYIGLFTYKKYNVVSEIDYSFDVFGILDKKAVDSLIEGKLYTLTGDVLHVKEPAEIWFDKSVRLPTIRIDVKGIQALSQTPTDFIILEH